MMVARREEQAGVLVQAVQNHNPDVVVVDEIGTAKVRRMRLHRLLCVWFYKYGLLYLGSVTHDAAPPTWLLSNCCCPCTWVLRCVSFGTMAGKVPVIIAALACS